MKLRHRRGRKSQGAVVKSSALAVIESLEERALLSFGVTATSGSFIVDTGAQSVFTVSRTNGDMTSMQYNGTELLAPFSSTNRYSHYESGLSSSTLVTATVDPSNQWIKIACDDTASGGVGVIQYYLAHNGDNDVYMATYAPGPSSPSPGEMRYITYLNWNIFANHPDPSDISAINGTAQTPIENIKADGSGDVYQDPVTGYTHSKYYGEMRSIDGSDYGATGSSGGSNFGAFMFIGNRETSSGGPFFKDIDFQSEGNAVELYNYMFSGHSQTENFRPGLQGPYAIALTDGSAPTAPDYSFINNVGLTGWVAPSGRGTLTGNAGGVPAGHAVTVALSNATAQYWTTPDVSGNYTIAGIKPGTYTETLYQDELAVGTQTATINAGATTAINITDIYYTPDASSTIWRVGTWDGTPIGFLNADKIQIMHPSDPRISPWVNTTFTIGTSADSAWPMAQFKDATLDNTNRITFNLTSAQAATAMTLRIGITRAASSGRPIISVNGGSYSAAPTASTQPATRGITLGNWRGNNWLYTYNISTSALHSGTNTIDIQVASGSSSTSPYLQPSIIYDAIDLVTTSSLTNAPKVTTISVSPANPNVNINSQQAFIATAKDQFGNVTPANFTWSANVGAVDGTGLYAAPGTPGSDTITATSGTVNGNTTINIVDTTPVQVTEAAFNYQTSQSLVFGFNKDIGASLSNTDLILQNLTTAQTIPSSSIHLSYSADVATFTAIGLLPDGNYQATIPANSVQDVYGNHMAADEVFNFYVMGGDANQDRSVDLLDLYILASNWGQTGATFGQGDFNYDGVVDGADLSILAKNWQQTLMPPLPAVPAVLSKLTRRAATRVIRLID